MRHTKRDLSLTIDEMPEKKRKLIEAAIRLVLRQGYSATTVDQICAEAGVTKGSFFHYFTNKEEIGSIAMEAWAGSWQDILSAARLETIPDPLDRLERLFEVMGSTYLRADIEPGCMIGTVAQEVAGSNRKLGDPCEDHFETWTSGVRKLLADAKTAHPPQTDFDPDSVADFMLGIVQGTLLVAKTRQNRDIVRNNIHHCRNYVRGLFGKIAPENS